MGFHKTVLWVTVAGLIVLVAVTAGVQQPLLRTVFAVLAVTPMVFVTIRIALGLEHRLAKERRKYLRLRSATDEFLMNTRNLNRLAVAAEQFATEPPVELVGQIQQVVERMHSLVDTMRDAAGDTVHPPGFIPGASPEVDLS